MEVVTPRSEHRLGLAPLGPVSVALGLGAAAVYTATHNPSSGKNWFPPCPLHAATGLWCPGCGMTRATARLLHGDLLGALSFNALTPIFLGLIVLSWLTWFRQTLHRRNFDLLLKIPPKWWSALVAATVAFGVVRNIPVAPFRYLAP